MSDIWWQVVPRALQSCSMACTLRHHITCFDLALSRAKFRGSAVRTMLKRMAGIFPYFTKGQVINGFGRGSKELGIPTANFPDEVVDELPAEFDCGVYFGWATVGNGPVHKMVMSVGWNPYYQNTKKSMETHIMHEFQEDFYGSVLKVCILGYIREEKSFNSLDALIAAIHGDIAEAKQRLDRPEHVTFHTHKFFNS